MDIYKKAIDLWGIDAQVDMVLEECAELIDILLKYKRNRANVAQVLFEVADVQLMLNQAKNIFGNQNYKLAFKYKYRRIKDKIDEEWLKKVDG